MTWPLIFIHPSLKGNLGSSCDVLRQKKVLLSEFYGIYETASSARKFCLEMTPPSTTTFPLLFSEHPKIPVCFSEAIFTTWVIEQTTHEFHLCAFICVKCLWEVSPWENIFESVIVCCKVMFAESNSYSGHRTTMHSHSQYKNEWTI